MTLCTNYLLLLGFLYFFCWLLLSLSIFYLFIYFFVYCQLCEWKRYTMHPVYVSLLSHGSGLHTLNVSMRLWHCDHCLFFKFWDLPLFICLYIYIFNIHNCKTCNKILFSKGFVTILWYLFIFLVNFI